ncbi:hypothetical protein NHX12_014102 [Muraenolepis orangiensis]|uniref:CSD domain-containing protein n=1 Tax=Muraenolepis orangiensis TaxID=630683 RepID=A0A9Q0DBP5_9TELE|nr:hypothetical protein NHX12_014102 [Muraenolepis orangiensis]
MIDDEVQSASPPPPPAPPAPLVPAPVPVDEKPQPERKTIATLVQGTVKWFNVRNGYGFINRNDNKEDVFVHQTAIKKNNPRKFLRSVGDGEVVEFDVIEAAKGSEAANVTGPGGQPVKGSRYAPNKRRFRRRFLPRSPPPEDKDANGQGPASDSEGRPEGEAARPLPRRRGPRRPRQEGEVGGAPSADPAEGDQQQQQRRRRFRPPFRRQFRPRPPAEQPGAEPQQPGAEQQPGEQLQPQQEAVVPPVAVPPVAVPPVAVPPVASDVKPPEADVKPPEAPGDPQANGELAEGLGQRPRGQFGRRRQRNSESSASKNGTEKSASEPGTPPPPPASKPVEPKSSSKSPKSSPKSSPKTTKSPEASISWS